MVVDNTMYMETFGRK